MLPHKLASILWRAHAHTAIMASEYLVLVIRVEFRQNSYSVIDRLLITDSASSVVA